MNQSFVQREWSHVTFVNREQDLGLEGLRKSKMSYHPVRKVEKYRILVYYFMLVIRGDTKAIYSLLRAVCFHTARDFFEKCYLFSCSSCSH